MGETEAVRGYPSHWEADVVLRDGATAHLRPISPEDAAELQRMHAGQSENSIYLRYFTYKSELSAKDLDRFTHVDHRDRVAFVITRGGRLLGVGRYDRYGDSDAAEVAFNISDAAQGRGLGSILMEHLAVAARENGIRRFTAEVLPENRKMLSVFQESGFEVTRRFEDGVVAVEFPIDPTARWRAVVESREHRAESRSVAELVEPASVAVVGASRDPQAVGSLVLRHVLEAGFTGAVHAVNRAAEDVQGLTAHRSLADIGEPVDLVVVAVPADEVEALIPEAAAAGAQGLVVLTSGYADAGAEGLEAQRRLVSRARAHGMRVIGPASAGLVRTDPAIRLNASPSPGLAQRGPVGLFSQSGAVGAMVSAGVKRRGVGISTSISAGNRADVSGNDAMQFFEADPHTAAVGVYLESFGNPRKFSRIARRLSRTKPVVVVRSDVTGRFLPRATRPAPPRPPRAPWTRCSTRPACSRPTRTRPCSTSSWPWPASRCPRATASSSWPTRSPWTGWAATPRPRPGWRSRPPSASSAANRASPRPPRRWSSPSGTPSATSRPTPSWCWPASACTRRTTSRSGWPTPSRTRPGTPASPCSAA